jgi:hypothetical protein
MKVIRPPRSREMNYRDFDTPAVQRKQAQGDELLAEDEALQELLDVPAFLRRQAN